MILRIVLTGLMLLSGVGGALAGAWQETYRQANVGRASLALGSPEGDGRTHLYLAGKRWTWLVGRWGAEELRKETVTFYPEADLENGGTSVIGQGPRGPAVYETGMDTHLYEILVGGGGVAVTDMGGVSGSQPIGKVAVGPGRGDSVTRVYAIKTGTLYEFSWDGSGWTQSVIEGAGLYNTSVAVGVGRGDGVPRLYVARHSNRVSAVSEYSWEGSTWVSRPVSTVNGTGDIERLIVGDGRGDGRLRVYGQLWDAHVMYEWTFVDGVWQETRAVYDTASWATGPGPSNGMVIGAAQADGPPRVYLVEGPSAYELTWAGSQWTVVRIGETSGPTRWGRSGWGDFLTGVVLGPGRNDGVPRVYGTTWNGTLYEWTFVGTAQPGQQGRVIDPPYPNPYRPAQSTKTWIPVVVSSAGWTTVTVHAASGELVRTLVDESREPGMYLESWNGQNEAGRPVGSGLYLFGAVVVGGRASAKLLVIR